ncbi:MAG: gamma-glutamylcyclotransferase family protein [Terriglobia bacterium]|nr:gamma-glutamylcyclotransferase family protein [Terriglobia bacterium]
MSDYLFTYGTLQPGHAPAEIARTVARFQLVGEDFVSGTLYDLLDYPAAILDSSSQRRIYGTVFRLPDHMSVLPVLDEYEEVDPDVPDKSLFVRLSHPITLVVGGTLDSWIYVYNRKPGTARIVRSGRWLDNRHLSIQPADFSED